MRRSRQRGEGRCVQLRPRRLGILRRFQQLFEARGKLLPLFEREPAAEKLRQAPAILAVGSEAIDADETREWRAKQPVELRHFELGDALDRRVDAEEGALENWREDGKQVRA